MAGTWQLTDIINKVRLTTGRPDATMMSDTTIISYINYFYQYVLPKELKIFWGYTYYTFFTQANQNQYPAPGTTFQTLNPGVTCDGFPIEWYLSPDNFYSDWPNKDNKQTVGNGNGTQTDFDFVISAYPVLPSSVYVTDGTSANTFLDNGNGGFINAPGSTVDYTDGSVEFIFPAGHVPGPNTTITVSSATFMANRPQAILYYPATALPDATAASIAATNFFVLAPVPDQTYEIKLQGIQVPAAFNAANQTGGIYTDVPFRTDLGPLIAYGASLEIFADFNQMDQYQQIQVQYQRYKDVSMQDTYEEYLYQRSVPAF